MAWGSLQDVSDAIYLNLGSGISAGFICGGRFLTGADGAAGEVGYTLFRGRPEERMAADGIGPFEAWFGGTGAARGSPTRAFQLGGRDIRTELDQPDCPPSSSTSSGPGSRS